MNTFILVTGGADFIGSQTCIALQEAGHDVVVLNKLCNSVLHDKSYLENKS